MALRLGALERPDVKRLWDGNGFFDRGCSVCIHAQNHGTQTTDIGCPTLVFFRNTALHWWGCTLLVLPLQELFFVFFAGGGRFSW